MAGGFFLLFSIHRGQVCDETKNERFSAFVFAFVCDMFASKRDMLALLARYICALR